MLAERGYKAEELSKKKKQAKREARVSSKRFVSKAQSSVSMKSKNFHEHFATSRDIWGRNEAVNALI